MGLSTVNDPAQFSKQEQFLSHGRQSNRPFQPPTHPRPVAYPLTIHHHPHHAGKTERRPGEIEKQAQEKSGQAEKIRMQAQEMLMQVERKRVKPQKYEGKSKKWSAEPKK